MKNIIILIIIIIIVGLQREAILRERKRRQQGEHDPLTGLCNWAHLVQKFEEKNWSDTPKYVIYSDIAEFKLINELFGRERGDEILKKLAEMIERIPVDNALYGRVGADHFVLIIDKKDFDQEFLLDCRSRLQEVLSDSVYNVRVYFGICEFTTPKESLASMCDKASIAVRSIKDNAPEVFAFYDEAMLESALQRKKIVDEFEVALKNGEFQMYLQPQIQAKGREIHGAEALVRRIRQDGTVVPPIEFISVYEWAGLIGQLDKYIWECAARTLGQWKQDGKTGRISVNISPKDFYYIDVYESFTELVEKYDIDPGCLNIEVTESALMSNIPNLRRDLERLRKVGFEVEIDDFGSGFSSLNSLKDIEVDALKIDMGFLQETVNKEKSRIILNAVVQMAKEIGMPVITEGVETIEQVDMLTEMGCDTFQGYYFSKPISLEEFEEKYMK